jgi:phage terminase small subunit
MGRRGPIPQSSVLKFLKGNPGKRKIDKNQPQLPAPELSDVNPPKRLHGAAAAEWERLYQQCADRGIIHAGNLKAFGEYCYLFGELQRIENVSRKHNVETAIELGLFRTAASLRQQLMQYLRALRLTELAGENLGASEKPEGKLAKFISPAR